MHSEAPASNCPQGLLRLCLFLRVAVCYTCDNKSEVAEVTEMKNRIIGVIQWLYVETAQGGHIRYLHPGEAPRAVFELGDETPVAVYAYCNLHGLWTTKL